MKTITKHSSVSLFSSNDVKAYTKRHSTMAVRINGPFKVETKEGTLSCPDGYVALDSSGWPYPIAKDDFEDMYVLADSHKP